MTSEKYFSHGLSYGADKIKVFNGLKYRLLGEYRSKEEAQREAKMARVSGSLARVVIQPKGVGWGKYAVYSSAKRKHLR